jgi:pseudouridine synthase
VEKTYIVEVDGRVGHGEIEKIKRGTWLGPERAGGRGAGELARAKQGERTERFGVKVVGRERGRTILEVKIAEGKNREIRRVMARVGHTVRDLNRVAIGERLTVRGLGVGEYRALSAKEVEWLYKVSSPERKAEERAATQAWYEKKEMEKERRRLSTETQHAKRKTQNREGGGEERGEKPFRPQPVRKGRKPFVPPSGRNAGKVLGGSFLGRKRLEREGGAPAHEDAGTIRAEIRANHPLGDAAGSDE